MKLFTHQEMRTVHEAISREGIRSDIDQLEDVFLKLECQLPTGSYKTRGVRSYFLDEMNRNQREITVLSAGNLALAAANECQKYGIQCRAVVPLGVSDAKKRGLIALGAKLDERPFEIIWKMVQSEEKKSEPGFLHPFHPNLLLGYSTIVLDLENQLNAMGGVVVPYGLGGLALSVVHGLQELRMDIPLYICEIGGHAPFFRAMETGAPTLGAKLCSFIEAMGTPQALPEVFKLLRGRVAGVIQISEKEVQRSLVQLYEVKNLRVEGAAAAAHAAAAKLAASGKKNVVALLTGKNISDAVFERLVHEAPG